MRSVAGRLWGGFVGAVCAGCLTFVWSIIVSIVGLPVGFALWAIPVLVIPGALLGIAGNGPSASKRPGGHPRALKSDVGS